jgi:hypothetical protein
VSGDAERQEAVAGPGWLRLRTVAERAAGELAAWRRRALAAEAEADRLGGLMEGGGEAMGEEIRRLRAENALLRERAASAREQLLAVARRIRRLEERG